MQNWTESHVETLIPHRGAMRLLDRVLLVDDEKAVAELEVPFDGMFVRDGQVPAWIGIEYMAQTVAAWAGARERSKGGAPRAGLLLGSRRYAAQCSAFPSGAKLQVVAQCELIGSNGLGQFHCRIERDGAVVAESHISVLDPPAGSNFLQRGGQA